MTTTTTNRADLKTAEQTRRYYCEKPDCHVKPFSKKYDLLRHWREVHGQSPSGSNYQKHFCPNVGCPRNKKGFPRHWNMLEHLRRVHDSGNTSSLAENNSSTPSKLSDLIRSPSHSLKRQLQSSSQDRTNSTLPPSPTFGTKEHQGAHCGVLRYELEVAKAEKDSKERAFADEIETLRVAKAEAMRQAETKIKALAAAVEIMEKEDTANDE